MTWRAIVHRHGMHHLCTSVKGGWTPRGSLVVETRLAASGQPQTILALRLTRPHYATLTLKAVPGGGVVLIIAGREMLYHAAVKLEAEARTDILRITYSWDEKGKAGRLALEWPERHRTKWVHTGPAIPIALEDLTRLGGFFDLAEAHPDLIYAALSDAVEPLGPMPALAAVTPIATELGAKALGKLLRGDLLSDPDHGAPQMVLDTVSRIVPALGSFAPVRLRAPYFGLERDIIVAPDQRLLVGGSEVEYAFGCQRVLIPARHLVNGVAALWESCGPLAEYWHVLLPQHAPVVAGGTVVESLYVGRMRRHEQFVNASLLGAVSRIFLPEQARAPYPVLTPFQAITLAESRAA